MGIGIKLLLKYFGNIRKFPFLLSFHVSFFPFYFYLSTLLLEILRAFAFASRHAFATKCDDVTNERYLHNDAVLINNLLDFAGISTSIHIYTVFHSS